MAKQRRHSLLVSAAAAAGGAVLAYGGYVASTWLRYGRPFIDRPTPNVLADRCLPAFEVRERHEVTVAAPASITWDVAYHLDLRSSWLVRAILSTRELLLRSRDKGPSRAEFLEEVLALGWGVLAEVPGRQLVLGPSRLIRSRRPHLSSERKRAWRRPTRDRAPVSGAIGHSSLPEFSSSAARRSAR
jgi:hypothetical protein